MCGVRGVQRAMSLSSMLGPNMQSGLGCRVELDLLASGGSKQQPSKRKIRKTECPMTLVQSLPKLWWLNPMKFNQAKFVQRTVCEACRAYILRCA